MQLAILKDAPLLDSIMTAKYLLDLHCGRGELVVVLKNTLLLTLIMISNPFSGRDELPEALKSSNVGRSGIVV